MDEREHARVLVQRVSVLREQAEALQQRTRDTIDRTTERIASLAVEGRIEAEHHDALGHAEE